MAKLPPFLRKLRPRKPLWRPLGLIALSSVLWALCYPPFPLGLFAFVALVPAFVATARLSGRQAFWYNFAGGLCYNTVMYWWIYNVIKVGPALIIGSGLVLLILYLSLYNALLAWLFRFLSGKRRGLIAFPFLWSGLEVMRTRGEMSFPWNNIGYTLGHWLSLIQSVSFLGIFGLSAVIVACNCLLFSAWRSAGRVRFAFAGVAALLPLLLALQGSLSLSRPDPKLDPESMDISLVQPSIPQTKKWDEHYFQDVMQKTWNTVDGGGKRDDGDSGVLADSSPVVGTDLIVLAETAVPDFLRSRGDVFSHLQRLAQESGADVLVGALDFVPDPQPYHQYKFYNSAFLFPGRPAAKDSIQQYSKLRLVPFSERLPFDDVFPIINYVNLGEGDFSPGTDYAIWKHRIPYAPSICYEIIYPDFVRGARRRGAKLMVNITNDGWFGYSNAPFQHANIARFRAVEAGVPIARCSNAGVSIFYDFKGRITGKTRLFEQTVLRRKIPLATEDTWYLRYGDQVEFLFLWFFLLGSIACIALAWRDARRLKSVDRSEPVESTRLEPMKGS